MNEISTIIAVHGFFFTASQLWQNASGSVSTVLFRTGEHTISRAQFTAGLPIQPGRPRRMSNPAATPASGVSAGHASDDRCWTDQHGYADTLQASYGPYAGRTERQEKKFGRLPDKIPPRKEWPV